MILPRLLPLVGLAVALAGAAPACASRTPPSSMPDDAPASTRAHAARPALVTRALDGEPPLPGTDGARGWAGLSPEAEADQPGGHEHAGHSAATYPVEGHADHAAPGAGTSNEQTGDGGRDGAHHHHGAH